MSRELVRTRINGFKLDKYRSNKETKERNGLSIVTDDRIRFASSGEDQYERYDQEKVK